MTGDWVLGDVHAPYGIVFASGEHAWSWQLPNEPVVLRTLELRDKSDNSHP